MNALDKSLPYRTEDIKLRLLDDITTSIIEHLSSYNSDSIQKLKEMLKRISESGFLIWKDTKTYGDAIARFNELGLITSEDDKNLRHYGKISVTSSGRKFGKASFEEAISDIYGIYIEALLDSLNLGNTSKLVDVNHIDLILQSVKNFELYIEKIKRDGFAVSGNSGILSYPYNIGDFREIEPIIQMIPRMENFGLKYLSKEVGIKFVDEQSREKVVEEVRGKTADIVKLEKPDRMNLFEGMDQTQKELISSYLESSNKILSKNEMRGYSKYNVTDKALFDSMIQQYRDFIDNIPLDIKNSVAIGLATLMTNFIDFFEAKVREISHADFDTPSKILFFTEALKEFNITLFRGILLHSETYEKFITTQGVFFSNNIKTLIGQKFSKLFPEAPLDAKAV